MTTDVDNTLTIADEWESYCREVLFPHGFTPETVAPLQALFYAGALASLALLAADVPPSVLKAELEGFQRGLVDAS